MKKLAAPVRRALDAILSGLVVPFNAFLALLCGIFLVSVLSLAFADRLVGTIFFFPTAGDGRLLGGRLLGGEYRELPRTRGTEARAALIAEEVLLGPMEPGLLPAFSTGIRAESVMVRKGVAYVDLSEGAAMEPAEGLKSGICALGRSIRTALPTLSRIVVTVGGREPWADGPALAAASGQALGSVAKIEEKN